MKLRKHSATPRLLTRSPWLLSTLLLPVLLGLYAAWRNERSVVASTTTPGLRDIPLEPPVELLEVEDSGLPCAVERVLKAKCRRCHTLPPRHAAPLPLLTWEQTRQLRHGQPVYELIGRAVKNDSMPFRIPANPPVERLTGEERLVLLDWVARGAPREECQQD